MNENQISQVIVDAAIEVHRTLGGPGLLENVYEECLAFELETRGLKAARQVEWPILYKGHQVAHPYRLDLLVEDAVIVEYKAVEAYNKIHEVQLLPYPRISFGHALAKDGIHRVVNNL
jgi:GxxExxY protein